MKHSFKLIVLAGAFMGSVSAQNDSAVRSSLGPSFYFESGSSAIPANIGNKFIAGGYIQSKNIDDFALRMPENLRAGVYSNINIGLHRKVNPTTSTDLIFYRVQAGGVNMNDDAFRLFFQGNGDYLGRTLDARIRKARSFSAYGIKAVWHKKLEPKGEKRIRSVVSFGISPSVLSGYSLAQNIDVNWDGSLTSAQRRGGAAGAGLLVDFTYGRLSLGNRKWRLRNIALRDFGVYYASNTREYSRKPEFSGTTTNITTSVATLREIFGGEWFKGRRDTLTQQLGIDSSAGQSWILSPFTISANLEFGRASILLRWRNLPGYLPYVEFKPTPILSGSRNFAITPSLAFGGFDTWNLNLQAFYLLKPQEQGGLEASASIMGLESLAFPGKQHGLGFQASVNFLF
jgi:hypothetical protein